MLRLANAFLFSYTTGLGPVLSLEEMILSGVTKFIDKVKIPQGITVKNFSFEGVSVKKRRLCRTFQCIEQFKFVITSLGVKGSLTCSKVHCVETI